METRLQKLLTGICSRRKAEEYIAAGRVRVNGVVAATGARADPARDTICLDGKPVLAQPALLYIMLHKPECVVTTAHDPQNRKTVLDLLPPGNRCFPVGRLDYMTSGLLLLTTDGDFAHRLTHPGHQVKKDYLARISGQPGEAALAAFRTGLFIDGRRTAPCEIALIKKAPNSVVRITLHEGRNRQVRKMCEAIGHPVLSLKRTAIGTLKLGDLPKGQWRHLTPQEILLC
ncbi:MAG: rRNA pseudouridine synthase [Defluviitaleaceae bacterium]|nr:rRNA pseudouridine synthase [Defluviitaleaceae bacterium]MCL2240177.1 rRNA pseudouridine synthase [Defluviitaleaceae bacterium]